MEEGAQAPFSFIMTKDNALIFTLAAALAGSTGYAQGADRAEGARKAQACQTCHGLDGLSRLAMTPHLAGQPHEYLVKTLKAYRSGERRDEMMAVVAKPLSDRDIEDLAAYYSAIEIRTAPAGR